MYFVHKKKCFLSLMVHLVGGVEKWEDKRDLVFSHMCLSERVEKWKDRRESWYKFTIMSQLGKTQINALYFY